MRANTSHDSQPVARVLPARMAGRLELAMFYGAFALIAAVTFGTLFVHRF